MPAPTSPPETLTIHYCPECGYTHLNEYGEALVHADGHCNNTDWELHRYVEVNAAARPTPEQLADLHEGEYPEGGQ